MHITLDVTKRDGTQSVKTVRANGNVPAVVYGSKQDPITIAVVAKEFDAVLKVAGESTILTLRGLEHDMEVLIKDVAFNPVKQIIQHVDFFVIEKGKDMTTHIPLVFVGVAPVEENGLGSVTKVLQEVTVTCKPNKLPAHIDVDISSLTSVDDKISVSDIKAPAGVVIDTDGHEAVAVVSENQELEADEAGPTTDDASSVKAS